MSSTEDVNGAFYMVFLVDENPGMYSIWSADYGNLNSWQLETSYISEEYVVISLPRTFGMTTYKATSNDWKPAVVYIQNPSGLLYYAGDTGVTTSSTTSDFTDTITTSSTSTMTTGSIDSPQLQNPSYGGTYAESPLLEWSSVIGASSYNVMVDDSDTFNSPIVNTDVSSTSYQVPSLSEGKP